MTRFGRLSVLTIASMFALSLGIGAALAAGEPDPPGARNPGPSSTQKPAAGQKESTGTKKKQKKSEQEFLDQYRAAYALKLAGDYQAAFAAFKALEADDHPDVATELGYAARKLGDYDLSKYWYEQALAIDPQHVKTWQYYGMWQVEQGNMLKAGDMLEKIRLICGTDCREYQDLKGGMEGTVTY
jgi:tetratricopeptide (TPR) repeat protein